MTAAPQPLELVASDLTPLYPAIYPHYRENDFGTITIGNPNNVAATELRLTALVVDLSRQADVLLANRRLGPGAQLQIPITAALAASVGRNERAVDVEVNIELTYLLGDESRSATFSLPTEMYGYAAISWQDTGRVAAFVTAEQQLINRFGAAGRAVAAAASLPGDSMLQTAVALYAGLQNVGMSHVSDFFTPFATALANPAEVDFVRFPGQTLAERWGDDLELALLFAALLEAAEVETALLFPNDGVLVAFALQGEALAELAGGVAAAVRRSAGKVWLTLDPTVLTGFDESVGAASRQLEGRDLEEVPTVLIRDAWLQYPAVAGPALAELAVDDAALAAAMRDAVRAFFAGRDD